MQSYYFWRNEGIHLISQTPGINVEGVLDGRVSPEIPGPRPPEHTEGDGWEAIDRIGAWDTYLSSFGVMEEVPSQHKASWVYAWGEVLSKEAAAETDIEKERALKWICFLSQALLRKPKRGGKSGRGLVNKRFASLAKSDWGGLVSQWEKDVKKGKEKENRRGRQTRRERRDVDDNRRREEENNRIRREILELVSKGQISKAVSRLSSNGVASITDPDVLEQMRSKYPSREINLPYNVTKGKCIDNLKGLREALLALDKGVAPGIGGLRPEFLLVLGEKMEEQQMHLLEQFGLKYLHGDLPEWFYVVWLSVQTVGLYKTSSKDTVRPIGIRNPLLKVFHREAIKANKEELLEYLEPQQLAMSQAGAAKLVHSVRMMVEEKREMVLVKLDIKNAFNEVSRSSIISSLENEPSLQHLAWHAACVMAPIHGLESGGNRWGTSEEGATQGDPDASPFFCVAWHPYVRELDETLGSVGGIARFGMDDGYLIGPPAVLFPALEKFEKQIWDNCSLLLQKSKTEVFTWDGELPVGATDGLIAAGIEVEERFEPGFLCYGVPIGTDEYVGYKLDQKVEEVAAGVQKACQVMEGESQALWALLRLSFSQQFDYWISLVHPSQVKLAAQKMNKVMGDMLEFLAGSKIPFDEMAEGNDCPLNVNVDIMREKPFQAIIKELPIKFGGLGIRDQSQLRHIAYISAIEQAIPFFGGESGICPPLARLSGEDELVTNRWSPLIESGCRTGQELAMSWNIVQKQAAQMAEYVDEELSGLLSDPLEGIGQGSSNGSSRKKIVEQLEQLKVKVLDKYFDEFPERQARSVWSWRNRDKLSTAWLMSLPGPHSSLSTPEFREAMAVVLCLPSPVCRGRVGEKVGSRRVDIYGDEVTNEPMPGDSWRFRHDKVKTEYNRLLRLCGVPATCEVWGVFSHIIPQQALNRSQAGRQRQGLIPDFKVQIPSSSGHDETRLAELKVISCGRSRYHVGSRDGQFKRAVDRRAGQLMGEYRRKAINMDRLIGTHEGIGQVQRRLEEFGELVGLVHGAFGEASHDAHNLISIMSKSRIRKVGLSQGRTCNEKELGVITGQLRRQISTVVVRSNAQCLLDRMGQVGEGAAMASKRREYNLVGEEWIRRDREVQWTSRVRGAPIIRRGLFFKE